MMINY